MDTQMAPTLGHNYDEDPHSVGLHSGEDDHHEKKSVLKKVKDKAKKIKDTLGIKKHDHGHNHDHDHDEEEEEEDEEIEEDPEVHGAPMYESEAARKFSTGQVANSRQSRVNLGQRPPLEEDPHAPKDRPESFSPANYQTKVTDPTSAGGEEAGISPLVQSFGMMKVVDKSEPNQKSSTGSHDQFSPDSHPTKTTGTPENPQQVRDQSFNASEPEDRPQDMKVRESTDQSSYTEKISSATSAIADKAASAKNIVASKLGYDGNDEYGRQIAATVTDKLAPVYNKVAEVGSAVVSKIQGTGSGSGSGSGTEGEVRGPDKGVSVKEYFAEKLRPGDEDRALSEVISDALHKRKEEAQEKVPQSLGKVTESPEVASRLGTDKESSREGLDTGSESTGKGMIDRLKGTVTSWFGKGGESRPPSQASHSPSHVGGQDVSRGAGQEVSHDSAGERKL